MGIFDHMFGQQGGHEHPEIHYLDPAKFPRSAEITDDNLRMALTQMDMNDEKQTTLNVALNRLMEELNMARAERVILDTKFWREIREKFPTVAIDKQCGMGYRKWDGKFFLVSWGGDEAHNSPQGGTETHSDE